MTKTVSLQHRHFVLIAEIIANIPAPCDRETIAKRFATALHNTNPRFDSARFMACAMGSPCNGRDA